MLASVSGGDPNRYFPPTFGAETMITIDPSSVNTARLQSILQGVVGPRPVCFASTIDNDGNSNLSPFSFFNIFSTNPPILIFSPARRVRDNTTKHSLENVMKVPEVVINIVNYSMVQQVSLSSTEYPKGVSEFIKAGFTPVPSETVKPFRVKESPAQLECIVKQVMPLGDQGGAGNLVICEVKMIHISEEVLDASQNVDQRKIDLVARMGGNWYCRAHGDALFEVEKPLLTLGVGVDALPDAIRFSPVLTGNELGQLGNSEKLPDASELKEFRDSGEFELKLGDFKESDFATHRLASRLLAEGNVQLALKVLLA